MSTAWTVAIIAAVALVTVVSLIAGRHRPPRHAPRPVPAPRHLPPNRSVYCTRCDVPLAWWPGLADGMGGDLTAGWAGGPGGLACHGIGGGKHVPLRGTVPMILTREDSP